MKERNRRNIPYEGRGHIVIHEKYGFIVGGMCHQRLRNRSNRDEGAQIYYRFLLEKNAVEKKGNKVKITKIPKEKRNQWYGIGCHLEIGVYRMKQDVCACLLGKWITKSQLKKLIDKAERPEDMSGTILFGKKPAKAENENRIYKDAKKNDPELVKGELK